MIFCIRMEGVHFLLKLESGLVGYIWLPCFAILWVWVIVVNAGHRPPVSKI